MTHAAESALQAYGAGLGLPGLSFGERGDVSLRMESGRTLAVARAGEQTLVYLSEPLGYDAGALMLKAAKRTHRSRLAGWPVQVAVRQAGDEGDRLIALVRIDDTDVTPLRLEQAAEFLMRWLDELRAE